MKKTILIAYLIVTLSSLPAFAIVDLDDIAVATANHLYVRDSDTLAGEQDTDGTGSSKVVLLSNGNLLTAANGLVTIREQSDLSLISSSTDFGDVISLASHASGIVALGTSDGNVYILGNDLSISKQLGTDYYDDPIGALAFQSDADILIGVGDLLVLRDSALVYKTYDDGYGTIADIAIQSDDDVVIGAGTTVYIRNADTLGNVAYNYGFANVGAVAVQSNDNVVAADNIAGVGAAYVGIYDGSTMAYTGSVSYGFTGVTDIAIQSDDDIVITDTAVNGTVYLRNPDLTNKAPAVYSSNFGTINNIAIIPAPLVIPSGLLFALPLDDNLNAAYAAGNPIEYYGPHGLHYYTAPILTTHDANAVWGRAAHYYDDYLTLKYNRANNVDLNQGTVDFFLRVEEIPTVEFVETRYILNIGGAGGLDLKVQYYQYPYWPGPRIVLSWGGVTEASVVWGTWLTPGEYSHIAITWDMTGGVDQGILRIFADGEERGSNIQSEVLLSPATPTEDFIWIAGHYTSRGAGFFDGFLDDFAIFDSVIYSPGAPYDVRQHPVMPPTTCQQAIDWGYAMPYDLNGDCYVDIQDITGFVANWLMCNVPDQAGCIQNW